VRFGISVLILLSVVLSSPCVAGDANSTSILRIENAYLAAELDRATLSFSLISKSSGLKFVDVAAVPDPNAQARQRPVQHEIWGAGNVIEILYRDGDIEQLSLFDGLPFAAVQLVLARKGSEPITLERLGPLSMTVNLAKQAGELRAFGTAGLTKLDPKSNPGSYSFLAVVDPNSRAGVVAGWVSHDRGSGVLFSNQKEGNAVINARLDYGGLRLKPGSTTASETLVVGYFDDARLGLEAYADAVARYYHITLPPQPTVYCTWYHANASNERDLIKNAQFAKENLSPYGFSVVQIDDGWQDGVKNNGPRKDFTKHRADGPYSSGMKQTADKVKELGLVPGIWFMPFAGTWNDPFFADKQDFFATQDGKPYEVNWGGTCFDLTNPRTRDYVRSMAQRISKDWGYRYFKLDGLWTGLATGMCYVNTGYKEDNLGRAKLYDPNKTHVEAYRDGLKLVREGAGRDVFILGCNMAQNMRVMGASFGLVDAMRVGPDNGTDWAKMCRGPLSGSNTYFLNGRVWYNDPDPIYVRDKVPLEQARTLVSWVAVTGQFNASSEDYAKLSPERVRLLRQSMPAHGLKARPVDLFEQKIPRIWLLTDDRTSPSRYIIGLFNWEPNEPAQIRCSLGRIGLLGARGGYVGFDYWADQFVEPLGRELETTVPGAGCRILAVRAVGLGPQVISTSRHITQGMVDVVDEKWDSRSSTLSGVSKVVGGEAYELRISAKVPAGYRRVVKVAVSQTNVDAGVKVSLVGQDEWKVRVRIDSPASGEVHWAIEFAPLGQS
jgi:hypothetical protein